MFYAPQEYFIWKDWLRKLQSDKYREREKVKFIILEYVPTLYEIRDLNILEMHTYLINKKSRVPVKEKKEKN